MDRDKIKFTSNFLTAELDEEEALQKVHETTDNPKQKYPKISSHLHTSDNNQQQYGPRLDHLSADQVHIPLYPIHSTSIPVRYAAPGRETIAKRTKTVLNKFTRFVHTMKVVRYVKQWPPGYLPHINLEQNRLSTFDPNRSNLMLPPENLIGVQNTYKHPYNVDLEQSIDMIHSFMYSFLSGRCRAQSIVKLFSPHGVLSIPAIFSLITSYSHLKSQLHYHRCSIDYSQLQGLQHVEKASLCFGDFIYNIVKTLLDDAHPLHLLAELFTFDVDIDRENVMLAGQDFHLTCPFMWTTRGLSNLGLENEIAFSGLLRVLFTAGGIIQYIVVSFDGHAVMAQCEKITAQQAALRAAI